MVAKASHPTTHNETDASERTFHIELRDDGSLPLPAELLAALSLLPGTVMEITASNGHLEARPVAQEPEEEDVRPMPPRHPAQGVLKDYLHGWDDIQQFIAEERRSWDREWDTLPEDSSTDN